MGKEREGGREASQWGESTSDHVRKGREGRKTICSGMF